MPKDGNPPPAWVIEVKTEEDIAGMRAAGKVARCACVCLRVSARVGARQRVDERLRYGQTTAMPLAAHL